MKNTLKENKVLFFFIKALFLYVLWYLIYELWLHPQGKIDTAVINNLISLSSALLKATGYELIPESTSETIRTIGIDGTHGVWIGDPCNGLSLFALFAGFVIAFPGPVKKKLWFIPLGLISIHLINVLRITALTIIVLKSPESLQFNHTYTFTIVVYSFVFLLWMLWANKLSGFQTARK